ncbi:MAG TPA: S53 family peptidase [Ktedonobacteraceae bacterium]|jgi:kumamolisin|nr:S53 family peptidase [Ktedonobacteraceae bacterium]
MQRNVARNFVFLSASILLIAASLLAMHLTVRASSDQHVLFQQQTAPLLKHAQQLGAADANQQLQLSIGLQLRNADQLDTLLSDIYNPQSPQYHQYLTPDQFEQLFAPTPGDVQQVVSFLQNSGLTVTGIAPNNLLIDATGTVARASAAFHIQINNYRVGSRVFYANATPPTLPASVSSLISSIGGLDNSIKFHPFYQRQPAQKTQSGPTGLGPKDLAAAYDATPLQNAGILGDNSTIALFELDGYQPSDVAQYFANYGMPTPNISRVLVDNYSGTAGMGAIEVELDIEIVGAIAPHANQIVYEGPNNVQGLNDTYNQIVHDNKAQIVDTSWGLCESSTGNAELKTLDNIFKQGAVQGMTFFAAAGDTGAYDCGDNNLGVDSPASDPYVTSVGGTTLQLNAGAYSSESVWSNPSDTMRGPKGAGSGGGLSNTFAMSSWQSGAGVLSSYSSNTPCGLPGGQYCREVPDVTAVADPATGYSIYCTITNAGCPNTGWMTLGGTSASAPFWAGSAALINQYLRSQNKPTLGYANPTLYKLFNAQQQFSASPFHDVTTGNNLFYPATTGYDLASGIGSPDIANMAYDLVALFGGNGTPTPTPTNPPSPTPNPSPTPPPALIQNSGFENGQAPWQESSSAGFQLIQSMNPHTGQNSAYLCGYPNCDDRIWQTFTVPSNYTKLTVSYWWYSDTAKNTKQCQDTFNARLLTTSGSTIVNLQQSCNTNANNAWVLVTVDISAALAPYKGKQVTLYFRGTNSSNPVQTSDFYVDDVAVNVQ